MDPRSGKFFDPAKATFIAQLGLKHFFDAFALEHQRDMQLIGTGCGRYPPYFGSKAGGGSIQAHTCASSGGSPG